MRLIAASLAACITCSAIAAEPPTTVEKRPLRERAPVTSLTLSPPKADDPLLSEIAADAGLIAAVKVLSVARSEVGYGDYQGHAVVEVLVSIRGVRSGEEILIEEGPEDGLACLIPEPDYERALRLLVFLEEREDGTWAKTACPQQVLVTEAGQYAVRAPLDGVRIDDEINVKEMAFSDPYAWLGPEDFSNVMTAEIARERMFMVDGEQGLRFTRGIPLWELRIKLQGVGFGARDDAQR